MSRSLRFLLIPCLLTLALCLATAYAQTTDTTDPQQQQATSFIASVAKLIYNAAWPTATYRGFNIDSIHPGPSGTLDVTTKFYGLSAFDSSSLWLLLTVRISPHGIENVFVRDHNAILQAPFATTRALGQLTLSLAQQYQAQSTTSVASTQPAAPPRAPAAQPAPAPTPAPSPALAGLAGAVCISNNTLTVVHFVFRWGDTGSWSPVSLPAQTTEAIWWPYTGNQPVSPELTVYYSEGATPNLQEHTYVLERSQSSLPVHCDQTTQYNFSVANNQLTLFRTPDAATSQHH